MEGNKSYYCGVEFEPSLPLQDFYRQIVDEFVAKNPGLTFTDIEYMTPHTTVLYSVGDCPISEFREACKRNCPKEPIVLRDFCFDLFGEGKDCLVLTFRSEQLEKWHSDILKEVGSKVSPTFPEYRPHMTIGYFSFDGEADCSLNLCKCDLKVIKVQISEGNQ